MAVEILPRRHNSRESGRCITFEMSKEWEIFWYCFLYCFHYFSLLLNYKDGFSIQLWVTSDHQALETHMLVHQFHRFTVSFLFSLYFTLLLPFPLPLQFLYQSLCFFSSVGPGSKNWGLIKEYKPNNFYFFHLPGISPLYIKQSSKILSYLTDNDPKL